jgi:hypothetical protein
MAGKARTFWATERIHGPAGRFRVVVSRMPAAGGNGREEYNATLFRSADDGEEAVEAAFWRHSAPPHDADKLAFRERARKAAQGEAAPET